MTSTQVGLARYTRLIVIFTICAILVAVVMLLPKGFSDDMSKIGQGTNVVVLTHNKNSVQSMELMELLNTVRSDYEEMVEFLVVDIDTREGQAFIRREGVSFGASVLVLFDGDGARKGILAGSVSEKELRSALDGIFSH
jgi:hypothetical protein